MQGNSLAGYRVSSEALKKYVRTQFADYNPPPIQQFLNIKRHNHSEVNAFTFEAMPRSQLSIEVGEMLQGEGILYLQSGSVQVHRREGRSWRRDIEYKQGSFFTLLNYRNMVSPEPQWFKLVFNSKAILSFLPIRPAYSFEWMKAVWLKNTILSKIFFYGDPELQIERKKQKFQEFIGHFKHQSFRRDTAIVQEGRKNNNIYIIAKGEAKLMKQLNVHIHGKTDSHRQVEILYLREGAILGGELFLISSRPIHTIINNHHPSTTIQEEKEQEEGEEEGMKKGKRSKSRLSKISVEEGGYQLYSPHQNVSNFTIRAESANLELFYIQIDALVTLISERYKINFLKMLQSTFITILRRTHEKMTIELRKAQQKIRNNHSKMESIAAKAYSAQENKSEVVSQQHQGISMKVSEIGMMHSTLHQFKNQEVRRSKDNHMEKRSELLTKEKRPVVDFKGKIEALIDIKLTKVKDEGNTQQLIQDFADIFMKKNEGRTEDIEKRNDLLQRKKSILHKRGGWKPGWDQLDQEGVKVQDKKIVETPNYLRGVSVQSLTAKIKGECNHKIHQTNKIKEQFMKIKSECPSCCCYQNFENFTTQRRTMSCMGRTGFKTAEGWGRISKVQMEEESLQKVYEKMSFLSERTKEKYNHNIHLLKVRRNRTQLQRRKSAPKFV